MDPRTLAELLGDWGYPIFFGLLCATGVGSPVPEDLLLLTAGYLQSAGVFSWSVALPLGVVGVVASDLVLYGWGRRLRAGVAGRWIHRLLPRRRLEHADDSLARAGDGTVFVARLVPGTRSVVFIGAGVRGMPIRRFLLLDTLGALVWVPIVLFVGTQLGEEIGGLDQLLATAGRVGGWLLLGALVLLVVWRIWRAEESKL